MNKKNFLVLFFLLFVLFGFSVVTVEDSNGIRKKYYLFGFEIGGKNER